MTTWGTSRKWKALFLTILMVMSVGAVPGALAADHTGPPPADETVEATTNVHVWDRGFLTLRADTSNAVTTIANGDWRVSNADGQETSLNRNPMAVYQQGSTVTIEFDDSRVNRAGLFQGEPVQVIAAHVEETDQRAIPTTVSDALDLVSSDNANQNASFEDLGTPTITGDPGTLEFTYTPSDPGQYVFFVATEETDGLEVINTDEITANDPATLIGIEQIAVRKDTGSVDVASEVERGNTVQFDVDAGSVQGSSITQGIVLYDEDTYIGESYLVDIQSEITSNFDIEANSVLDTTVSDVNGVSSLGASSVLNVDLNDGSVTRTGEIVALADFIAEEAGSSSSDANLGGGPTLHGSISTVSSSSSATTVDVDTLSDWATRDYRWIYIAVGDTSQEVAVDTGTISVTEVQEEQPPSGGGGGGGGGGVSGPTTRSPRVSQTNGQATASVAVVNEGDTISVETNIGPESETTPLSSVTSVEITSPESALSVQVTVTASDAPVENVPAFTGAGGSMGYITVNIQNMDNPDQAAGTIGFQVSEQRVSERGYSPEQVTLFRYAGDSYNALPTSYLGDGQYEASTDGFSTFAVGVRTAAISPVNAELSQTEIQAGDTVDVTVNLENTGTEDGTQEVTILADGEPAATSQVTVPAGETVSETIPVQFDEPGEYEITVGDVTVGTVTVSSVETETDPGAATPATEAPPDDDEAAPGLPIVTILVVIAILLVVGAGVYYYSQMQE